MKKITKIFLGLIVMFLLSSISFAQETVESVWALTDSTDAVVTGNIAADDMSLAGTLGIKDFNGGDSSGAAVRINAGTVGWSASETGPDYTRYIQFLAKPATGYDLHVDSIAFWLGCYGTHGNMHAAVYWDVDTASFTQNNLLDYDSSSAGLPDVRDRSQHDTSFTINTDVNDGGLFAFRVYPWYDASSASTSKYVVMWNVRVYGTVTQGNIPVELTSFTAVNSKNAVHLKWATATEVDNNGFEIERSADRTNWKRLAFVKGNGTTTNASSYSYKDVPNINGKLYYRLKQVDFNGTFKYSKIVEVSYGVPSKFTLAQNYPNPFNPSTSIKFELSEASFVNLTIFNILGAQVATLVNEKLEPGTYTKNFIAVNLTSGIYFYRLTAGNFVVTKKMSLLK